MSSTFMIKISNNSWGLYFKESTEKRSIVGIEWVKNEVPSREKEASFPLDGKDLFVNRDEILGFDTWAFRSLYPLP